MQESRREIVDRFLAFVGELKDVAARTVAEQLLMSSIHSIWLKHPFRSFLMPDPFALTTVAGTRSYILPPYFGRVAARDKRLQNLTTGGRLSPVEGEDLLARYPAVGTTQDTQTGEPSLYQIAGVCGLNVQLPAAGLALEVISDNANDTDVQVVLEGLDSTGQYTQAAVTLNGIVAVAIGTWTKGQNFSKSWPQSITAPTSMDTLANALPYTSSRGVVKLRSAVDHATVYQTLLPNESLREQWTITFFRTPDRVYSIGVPILRLPRRLIYDADPVPLMWGPALVEEMLREWQINTGEQRNPYGPSATDTTQKLIDLIVWDNELRSGGRQHSQPFGENGL